MQWRLFAEAQAEIDEAAAYYDNQQQGLGKQFIESVYTAIKLTVSTPLIGAKIYQDTRRVFIKRFPYAIIYLPTDDEIIILAVMHSRRHPDYWKNRMCLPE